MGGDTPYTSHTICCMSVDDVTLYRRVDDVTLYRRVDDVMHNTR